MKVYKILGILLLSTVFAVNGFAEIPKKVKVSSNDSTAGFLNGKLVAGTNVAFVEGNDGQNEILTINVSGGGTGTVNTIKESTSQVGDADIASLDFGSCFDLAESPDTEVNIDLDLSECVTGDVTYTGNVANVTEADALAANGGNCSAGSYPLGTDASGVVEGCTDATTEIDSVVATHTANSSAHHTATVNTDNQNLFETISTTSGTAPVADTATDTLTLTAGTNITITGDASTDTVTIASTGTGYSTIDDEGTPLTQRATLNFIGAGVSCVDDGAGLETDCTISGGGAPAFTDITSGTNTTAAMVVGTGGSLTVSGSGTINSTTGDTATAFFSTGTIEHERGGLESDVNAFDGLVGITGGATFNQTGTTTQIVIFDGSGAPTSAALSADATMTNAGVVTVISSSTTTAGKIEVAIATETTTGTDATRAVSPDGLAGSDYGKRVSFLVVLDDTTDTVVGNGTGDFTFRIPAVMSGYNLVDIECGVYVAGTTNTTDIQVANVTQAADMLSTKCTIDSTETDSSTAATAPVIDGANDDVATADQIRIDTDAVSTTAAKGMYVELTFQLP